MARARLRALFFGLVTSLAVAGASPTPVHAQSSQPSPADVKKATQHFEKGSEFFEKKKYALALQEFKVSYATVPSPNSHLYMARCLVQLGETREAYVEFDKVIAEAEARSKTEPKYAPTRDSAKTERDELNSKLAFVTVQVKGGDPSAKVKIGTIEIPASEWGKPVPVMPGAGEVVLEGPGPAVKQSVNLSPGEKKEVTLDATPEPAHTEPHPEPPPPDKTVETPSHGGDPKLRPYAYVAGGVGVAGLAVFTVAGLMANSTYSDLQNTCKGPCPSDRKDDVSAGRTQQTLANIGLVVGVLGVGAGVTLFILSRGGSSENKTGSAQRETGSTSVLVGPGFTGVRGTF